MSKRPSVKSKLKIKIDEQLSELLKAPLAEAGYEDVETVLEEGLSGKLDEDLWPIIQQEGRFLITGDKGFGDIRKYPPRTHAGVLLLRPDYESILSFIEVLKSVLKKYNLEDLQGTISVVTPRNIRVRTQ